MKNKFPQIFALLFIAILGAWVISQVTRKSSLRSSGKKISMNKEECACIIQLDSPNAQNFTSSRLIESLDSWGIRSSGEFQLSVDIAGKSLTFNIKTKDDGLIRDIQEIISKNGLKVGSFSISESGLAKLWAEDNDKLDPFRAADQSSFKNLIGKFQNKGVYFPPKSSITYNSMDGLLIVATWPFELKRIDAVIIGLNEK